MTERKKSKPTQAEIDAYNAALDHMVDSRGISYDVARRELGQSPSELHQEQKSSPAAQPLGKAAAKSAVRRPGRRSGHGPQYGEEEGVGYPDGKPPYYQPYVPLSDEQIAINQRGLDAVRQALEKKQSHDPNDD